MIPCEEDEKKKNEVLKTEKEQKKEQKGQKKEKVKRGFFSKKGNRKEELSGIEIPGLDIQIPEISDNKKYEKDEQIKREIVLHTQKTGLEVHNVEKQDFGKTLYAYEDSEKTVYVPQQSNVEKNNFELYRNRTHETFEIVQKVSRVGRKRDVVEIYINGNRSIGRIHAILYIKEGNVYIEDNASKNGTYVDGVQIRVGMKPYLLKNKMKIRMGDEDFEFRQKNLERE